MIAGDVALQGFLLIAFLAGVFLSLRVDPRKVPHLKVGLLLALAGLEGSLWLGVVADRYLFSPALKQFAMFLSIVPLAAFILAFAAGATICVYPRRAPRYYGLVLIVLALTPIPATILSRWVMTWVIEPLADSLAT